MKAEISGLLRKPLRRPCRRSGAPRAARASRARSPARRAVRAAAARAQISRSVASPSHWHAPLDSASFAHRRTAAAISGSL